VFERAGQSWWELRRDASGQAPDPAETSDAVLQVYAARAVGWRGVVAVHSWISVKPSGAPAYTRYEVMGWGVGNGAPAVRVNRSTGAGRTTTGSGAGPNAWWTGGATAWTY
jgi:hypothetical protein